MNTNTWIVITSAVTTAGATVALAFYNVRLAWSAKLASEAAERSAASSERSALTSQRSLVLQFAPVLVPFRGGFFPDPTRPGFDRPLESVSFEVKNLGAHPALEVVVSLDGDRFGVLLPAQRGLLAGGDRWEDAIELPSFNNSWDQHSEVKLRVRYQSVLGNEFRMTHIYPQAGDTTFVAEWRRSVDQDWTSLTLANP